MADPSALTRQQARELRDQGIAELRAGHKSEAQELLARSVELNPSDENTWLWLSGSADTDEDRRFCLEKVLSLNPGNEAAKKGLARLPAAPATGATIPLTPPKAQSAPATPAPAPMPAPPVAPAAPDYSQAAPVSYDSYYVPSDTQVYRRSGCVSCLAMLALLSGIAGLIVLALFGAVADQLGTYLQVMNIPTTYAAIGLAILAVVAVGQLATGVGLWTGKRFAWWLTIFWFVYDIVKGLASMVDTVMHKSEINAIEAMISPQYVGRIFAMTLIISFVSILISALVLTFLFIPNTLGFFKLSRVKRGQALAIVFMISLVLTGASFTSGSASLQQTQQQLKQLRPLQTPTPRRR